MLVSTSGRQVKGEETQTAEVVNVEGLLPKDRDYLTYQVATIILILINITITQGSLTTPERVNWLLLTNPISVSSATLAR